MDMALVCLMGCGNDHFPCISVRAFEGMWANYCQLRSSQSHCRCRQAPMQALTYQIIECPIGQHELKQLRFISGMLSTAMDAAEETHQLLCLASILWQ